MAMTRREFLLGSASLALIAWSTKAEALLHRGSPGANSNTVVNFFAGAGPQYAEGAYLNYAKIMSWGSAESGWPGRLNASGFPSGTQTLSMPLQTSVFFDPGYYGHWTYSLTAAKVTLGSINDNNIIVYSGGAFTSLNPSTRGELLGGAFITGTNPIVEFAFGYLLKAVGSNAGLVLFTVNKLNSFNLSTGATITLNNVTGLPAGPNADGSWTINFIDNNNFSLQGSGAFVGLVSGTFTGGPGTRSEAIYSVSIKNTSTMSGTVSNLTDIRLYKSGDAADFTAPGVNGSTGLLASRNAIATVRGMGPPAYLRFMDLIGTLYPLSPAFAQRNLPGNIQWTLFQNPSTLWGGVMTQSGDNYTVANPLASPVSGGYVDGEVVIAQVAAAGASAGNRPRLGLTGRTGDAPIYTADCTQLNLLFNGSVPPVGTTLTFGFTGGGVNGTQNYTYTTTSGDTSFAALAANIRFDFDANPSGHSTAMLAAGMSCVNPGDVANSLMQLTNCPNINFAGTTGLGISPLSIALTDPSSSMTITQAFVSVGYLQNNAVCTFVFSSLVQGWLSSVGDGGSNLVNGINGGPPLEFLAEVCARIGSGLWYNIPVLASASDITSTITFLATATYNGQPAIKTLALEWGNEIWNTQSLTGIAQTFGNALRTPGSLYSLHALRNIEMAQLAVAAWTGAGRSRSTLKIAGTYQFVRPTDFQATYLNGQDLNCASASSTFAVVKAFGGLGQTAMPSVDYSSAPNRPVDFYDWISPAPYWGGSLYNALGGFQQISPLSTYNNLFLSAWNFAYGKPTQQSAALDFCFNGTSGDFYSTTQTTGAGQYAFLPALWALGSGQPSAGYFGVGTLCASYDASRSGTGTGAGAQLKLGVACYEGGWFMNPTNGGQFVAGLTGYYTLNYASGLPGAAANPGGVTDDATGMSNLIYQLLVAWKHDNRANLMVAKQLADFKAAVNLGGTRDAFPAWYGFQGPSNFGLWDSTTTAGQPYKVSNAIAAFH